MIARITSVAAGGLSLGTADANRRAAYRRQLRWWALPWSIAMLLVSWPIPLLTGLLLYRLVLQLHSRDSLLVDLSGGVGSCCGRTGFVDRE
ncbi:hypothetical protein, partial [Nocardia sp. NPDC059229]|uniref:hypothetical protein n=1 Tax=Nocardia sp. NPDC059229 TaxID=3346778 RepID=UPI0036BED74A